LPSLIAWQCSARFIRCQPRRCLTDARAALPRQLLPSSTPYVSICSSSTPYVSLLHPLLMFPLLSSRALGLIDARS
jgi:hypothetical protein